MKVSIKTPQQIQNIRESCHLLAQMMNDLEPLVKEGNTPLQLDKFAYDWIISHNAQPNFLGYNGYPNTICVGTNDMATHGVPTDRPFQNGDMITIDAGLFYKGMNSDMAKTYTIGDVTKEKREFIQVVKEAFEKALAAARAGNFVGDISYAIHSNVKPHGYSPLIEYVGHGIGIRMHEDPIIPGAYGQKGDGIMLKPGMTLAIETLINMGGPKVYVSKKDGWSTYTADGSMFALFEHTILVTESAPEILTKI